MVIRRVLPLAATIVLLAGCSDDEDPTPPVIDPPIDGATARFVVDADYAADGAFYDFPFPSDVRLLDGGQPDYRGFPYPTDNRAVATLVEAAMDRPGQPVIPAAYFRFDANSLPELDLTALYDTAEDDILLVDVDPDSTRRGEVFPARAITPAPGAYTPDQLLAVGPYPGIVLDPDTSYAVVVRRGLGVSPLGVPEALTQLAEGTAPDGPRGDALLALYTPVFETLDTLGISRTDVAVATVFTTGDVVAETKSFSDAILADHDATIADLELAPSGDGNARICELHGTLTVPTFQVGTAPFPTDGRFDVVDGVPQPQGTETIDIAIAIPKQEMPAAGYPFVLYIHGSGGLSTQLIDRGTITTSGGSATPGEGPAFVLAEHGIASAGAAMPINPQRVPGAGAFDYINFSNPGAFSYTFRQGTFEQRLFLEALERLTIDPQVLAGCTGATLPMGETAYKFDFSRLGAMGQSMGAEYVNLLAAVEPKVQIVAPTGAGGHWSHFLDTSILFGGVDVVAGDVFGIPSEEVRYLHPGVALLQNAWEAGDALPSVPRIAHAPFDGHPSRHIYTPAAPGDLFWSPEVYDAMALGYRTQQAGDPQWDMQAALALLGAEGFADYPARDNRQSLGGQSFTAVVVHFEGDGIADPHTIFSQRDDVKYQYGCFFQSYIATGTATVPAPAALGTPCQN